MNISYARIYSGSLNREVEMKIYGHSGKPMVVFPSSGGSFYEYEDFGMVNAIAKYIDEGRIILFTPEGIDNETWLNHGGWAGDKARRHNDYDSFVVNELVPFIKHTTGYQGKMALSGCSLGGFHAVNFYLRHPDVFDLAISLSGVYDLRALVGESMGDHDVYVNSPVDYMKGMNDPWFLDQYRQNTLILCSGLGRWEENTIKDTLALKAIFAEKGIPVWIDFWGNDVDHDWPWWRVQMPFFLEELTRQGKL